MADGDKVSDLERRLHQREVRADRDQLERLLHPEFVEFGASGRLLGREAVIAALVAALPAAFKDFPTPAGGGRVREQAVTSLPGGRFDHSTWRRPRLRPHCRL